MAETAQIKLKLRGIYFFLFIFFGLLVAFSVRWQIVNADQMREIAENRVYSSELNSFRGSIYAADGTTLAYSEPRFDMYVWYEDLEFFEDKEVQTREEFLEKVAPIIDTTPEKLGKLIEEQNEKGIRWIPIADHLTSEQWKTLTELKIDGDTSIPLRGFAFEYTSERVYPENRLAAHIVGLTTQTISTTDAGLSGLESYWNGDLNPRKGYVVQENDAVGQALASALVPTIEPKEGSSIYTSIDKNIQKKIESQLKKGVEQYDAKSGTIIVMDPKTGEIMAMASYPDYNPNLREEKNIDNYGNIAITSPYEIGSVGKIMTLAAGIDLDIIEPDSVVLENGHQGCEIISNNIPPICTWDKSPQGQLTMTECLVKSDNLCFYHLSKKIENSDFYDYLDKFGVGKSTGIDVTGESIGILRDVGDWDITDVATFSYGHGYQINAVQTVDAISAIANKGVRMKPKIVTKVVKGDGEEIPQNPVVLERVVSEQTAATVTNMMKEVYQDQVIEYHLQHLKEYPIALKSGTAVIANQFGYTSEINGTHVGYDASEERKFIMLVRLEEPQVGGLAFYNSRILWLETFDLLKEELGMTK